MYLSKAKLKDRYVRHLNSQYWIEFRRDNLKAYCQNCGSKQNRDLHHVSYLHFGKEKQYPGDVISLCRKCHDKIHFNAWGFRRKDWRYYSDSMVKGKGVTTGNWKQVIILLVALLIAYIAMVIFKLPGR
jgi:hypothetical protein